MSNEEKEKTYTKRDLSSGSGVQKRSTGDQGQISNQCTLQWFAAAISALRAAATEAEEAPERSEAGRRRGRPEAAPRRVARREKMKAKACIATRGIYNMGILYIVKGCR